jgi:hypothetical protein
MMQLQVNATKPRLPLKRSRRARLRASIPSVPTRRRQQQPPWRLIGAVALPVVAVGVVALVARRRFFQGVVLLAKAVEEAADVVEDAAEDLGAAAKARADKGQAST